ncbi:MAG: hypothetical protein A2231_06660 [Candidatus Firestonebacteria bacterium RIFOXYA2_FULL_40_8]|nr:MAG: hypothetical protein A2231_06660 [Candidatus Firestonebacteria bacterium RIFOXYA2_FULL_40_8]
MKNTLLLVLIVLSGISYAQDKEKLKNMFNNASTDTSFVYAAKSMAETGDKTIIPKIIDKIRGLIDGKDDNIDTVEELMGGLACFKDKSVISFMYELINMKDLNPRIFRMSVYVLGEIGDSSIFPELIVILQGERNYELRREVVWAFGKVKIKEAAPILAKLYPDEETSVRGVIALSMYNFESPEALSVLQGELKYEKNEWVKEKLNWVINKTRKNKELP